MRDYLKYGLVVFGIAVLMGLLMSQVLKSKSSGDIIAQNITGNQVEVGSSNGGDAIETSSLEEKILPTAKLTLETDYEDCNHKEIEEKDVPKKLVNLNEDELQEVYSDWSINEFSNSRVYLYKLSEGICGKHFKVSIDKNNKIIVYKLTSDYDTEIYKETDITTEYLPEEDIKKLEEGIYVYGEAELNSLLESYE